MSHDATLKSLQEGCCGLLTTIAIPDLSYLRNAEHREILVSGLRLAAGEPQWQRNTWKCFNVE